MVRRKNQSNLRASIFVIAVSFYKFRRFNLCNCMFNLTLKQEKYKYQGSHYFHKVVQESDRLIHAMHFNIEVIYIFFMRALHSTMCRLSIAAGIRRLIKIVFHCSLFSHTGIFVSSSLLSFYISFVSSFSFFESESSSNLFFFLFCLNNQVD